MERDRPIRDGNPVLHSDRSGKRRFELLEMWPFARYPRRKKRIDHRAKFAARQIGSRHLHEARPAVNEHVDESAVIVDYRVELVRFVATQRIGAQVIAYTGTGDRRAVKNSAPDVLEENSSDQPLLVVDDKTAFRRVVDAFFRSCKHILELVANERPILLRPLFLCSSS